MSQIEILQNQINMQQQFINDYLEISCIDYTYKIHLSNISHIEFPAHISLFINCFEIIIKNVNNINLSTHININKTIPKIIEINQYHNFNHHCLEQHYCFNKNFKLIKCKTITFDSIFNIKGYENLPLSIEEIKIINMNYNYIQTIFQNSLLPNLQTLYWRRHIKKFMMH
jgi:hypothetical protein